jgi:hypothetical protein
MAYTVKHKATEWEIRDSNSARGTKFFAFPKRPDLLRCPSIFMVDGYRGLFLSTWDWQLSSTDCRGQERIELDLPFPIRLHGVHTDNFYYMISNMPACSKSKSPYMAPGGSTVVRSASYSGRSTPRVSLQYSLYGRSVGPLSPSIRGSICVTLTIPLWTDIFNGLQSTVENASTHIDRIWRDALAQGHLYRYQNISNKLRWHNYINKCVRGRSFKLHCTLKKRPSDIVFTWTSHTKGLK